MSLPTFDSVQAGDIGECHTYDEPKGNFSSILLECYTYFGTPTYGVYPTDTCSTIGGLTVRWIYRSTCWAWGEFDGASWLCNLEDSGERLAAVNPHRS